MEEFIAQNKDIVDLLLQIVYLVVPIVISWLIRTYVRNSNYERQIASIVRLSNVAIDTMENMEKRGELVVPPGMKKGQFKLNQAAEWLEAELNTNGIKVSTDDATRWISAEFQKRLGGVHTTSITQEMTKMAVDLIQGLGKGNLSELAEDKERLDLFVSLAADWLSARLSEQRGVRINHEEADTWVRAELLNRLQVKQLPSGDTLMDLARQAVAYVNGLKASGRLAARPGMPAEFDIDIAAAWMLTEALQLGMSVTPEEIANAVNTVIRARKSATGGANP
jgi:hypothetical protein